MNHILWLLLYALETVAENPIQEFLDVGEMYSKNRKTLKIVQNK